MRKITLILVPILMMLTPWKASAQFDAIIDAIVSAAEPTPVYDVELTQATERLADKIERLNNVLFGGAEQTSAAYRYRTMYSDLHDITTSLTDYISRSYSNAKRLEKMYTDMEGDDIGSMAYKVQDSWYTYKSTVEGGKRLVEKFRRVFSDHSMTNSEVRAAARQTQQELQHQMLLEQRQVDEEIQATQIASGLVSASEFMTPSASAYVSRGRKQYGLSVSQGGSSSVTGTLGTAVMVVISLMCIIFTMFTGFHIIKGNERGELLIGRMIFVIVFSLVIILAIQQSIS